MSKIAKVCKVKYRGENYKLYSFNSWDSGFSITFLLGCTDVTYAYTNGYEMVTYNECSVGWEDRDWWDRKLPMFKEVVYKFMPKCTGKIFDEFIDTLSLQHDFDINEFHSDFELIEKYNKMI